MALDAHPSFGDDPRVPNAYRTALRNHNEWVGILTVYQERLRNIARRTTFAHQSWESPPFLRVEPLQRALESYKTTRTTGARALAPLSDWQAHWLLQAYGAYQRRYVPDDVIPELRAGLYAVAEALLRPKHPRTGDPWFPDADPNVPTPGWTQTVRAFLDFLADFEDRTVKRCYQNPYVLRGVYGRTQALLRPDPKYPPVFTDADLDVLRYAAARLRGGDGRSAGRPPPPLLDHVLDRVLGVRYYADAAADDGRRRFDAAEGDAPATVNETWRETACAYLVLLRDGENDPAVRDRLGTAAAVKRLTDALIRTTTAADGALERIRCTPGEYEALRYVQAGVRSRFPRLYGVAFVGAVAVLEASPSPRRGAVVRAPPADAAVWAATLCAVRQRVLALERLDHAGRRTADAARLCRRLTELAAAPDPAAAWSWSPAERDWLARAAAGGRLAYWYPDLYVDRLLLPT